MFKLAILGEIGSGNLGDDFGYCLIRDILYKIFYKYDVICNIDYYAPVQFSQLRNSRYDAVVTSCGTLLDNAGGNYVNELLRCQRAGSKIGVLGTGLSDPDHIFTTDDGVEQLKELMGKCSYSWIRGEDGPDVFWVYGKYCTTAPLYNEDQTFAINMGRAAFTYTDKLDIVKQISQCATHFEKTMNMKIVSAWTADKDTYPKNISDKYPEVYVNGERKHNSDFRSIDYMVSFRAHLGVMATCCGLLAFPISFSSKVKKIFDLAIDDMTFLDVRKDNWIETITKILPKSREIRAEREKKVKIAADIVYNNLEKYVKAVI